MVSEGIERVIGRLEAGMGTLSDVVARLDKNTREDFQSVFAKLEAISGEGCAKGKENAKRIAEHETKHENRPGRWAAIVSSIAAVISAISAVAVFIGLKK